MTRLLTILCALCFSLASHPAAASEPTRAPRLGTDTRPRKPDQPRAKGGAGASQQQQGSKDEGEGSGGDHGKKVEKKDDGHDKK